MANQSVVTAVVVVVFLMSAAGCRKHPAVGREISVGLITYRAEDLNGPSTSNAAALAFAEIQAQGGLQTAGSVMTLRPVPVTIVEENQEEAVAAVQRLINQENVSAIIGLQNSDEAIPAGGLAEQAGVPLIAPIANNRKVTEGRKFVFRIGALADVEAKALAILAKETLGARRAAILYQANLEYSRTIAEAFSREFHAGGGIICAVEKFVPSSLDFAAAIRKIRASAPQVILLPNSNSSVVQTGKLLRQAGVTAVLIGPDSWSRILLRSLPEFDGACMVTNWSPGVKSAESEKFVEAYRKRFNVEPTETAALTYDACRVLFAALRLQTDISPRAIRDTLTTMADVDGVSGCLEFRDGADPVKSLTLIRFKSGKEIFSTLPMPGIVR